MAIVTKEDLLAFLGVDPNDAQDAQIALIHAGIDQAIKGYCRREFEAPSVDDTEYIDGTGMPTLLVSKIPIISLTSVTHVSSNGTETAVDSGDYWRYDDAGILKIKSGTWEEGSRNYKILYRGGYTQANMPADVRQAFFLWAAHLWKQTEHRLFGTTSVAIGEKTMSYNFTDMPGSVSKLLSRWIKYA